MNIVVCRPNCNNNYQESIKDLRAIEPPLWHLILCNYYHTDFLVDAEGENYTIAQTIDKIISYNPDKVIILSSGSHPSAFIQQKEIAFKLDLLLSKKHIYTETYSYLPFDPCKWVSPRIKWELIDINKYKSHNWHSWSNNCNRSPYGVIFTSISCPFRCSYCVVHQFYGIQFEQRLIEDVIRDFDDLAKLNIKNIKIIDELFIFNSNRINLICDELIKREYDFNIWAYARIDIMNDKLLKKMRKAGIKWLAYGIEHGSEEMRKSIFKGSFSNNKIREVIKMTKDNNIYTVGNYMFGFWEDNLNTMQETLDLAFELNCEFANFYTLTIFENTPLYEEYKKKNVALPTSYYQYAQMAECFYPVDTKYLSGKKVLQFRDEAFLKYYTSSPYLNMMQHQFGDKIIKDIKQMTSKKLKRDYLD